MIIDTRMLLGCSRPRPAAKNVTVRHRKVVEQGITPRLTRQTCGDPRLTAPILSHEIFKTVLMQAEAIVACRRATGDAFPRVTGRLQREGNESSPHCDGSTPQPYRTRDARPRLPLPALPRDQGQRRTQTAGCRRLSRSCCCRDLPHSRSSPTCTDAPWGWVSIVDLFKCDRAAGKGKERAEVGGGREGGRK